MWLYILIALAIIIAVLIWDKSDTTDDQYLGKEKNE